MIYFTFNPNDKYYHEFLFKSDTSTQELDRFFAKNQGLGIFPHSLDFNRKRNRTINENFGIYQKVPTSITQGKIINLEKDYKEQLKYVDYDEWCNIAKNTQQKYLENYNPSNESKIRTKSKELLNKLHEIKFIQDEYTHTSLPVRADIFAVSKNKEVITVEIKSDKDTFVRLEKQLKEYMIFSHITYVALDISHLPKFLKKFNTYLFDCLGIMIYENNEVFLYSEPYKSKKINTTNLLWKDEYLQFISPLNFSVSKMNVDTAVNMIKRLFTVYEFETISEALFLNRYLQDKSFKVEDLIEDIEFKNKRATKTYKDVCNEKKLI